MMFISSGSINGLMDAVVELIVAVAAGDDKDVYWSNLLGQGCVRSILILSRCDGGSC